MVCPKAINALLTRALLALCLVAVLMMLTGCTADLASTYNDALDTFGTGDFAAAAAEFDQLGNFMQAASYAAYSHGLTYYEQGNYAAAAPYFEQTQGFKFATQRYTYCQGAVLQAAGDFSGAAKVFETLVDFEDAATCRLYCQARDAEINKDYPSALMDYEAAGDYGDAVDRLDNLRTQIYYYAKDLKAAKNYEQAVILFSLLGDYLHAQEEASACKDIQRDVQYDAGDAAVAAGDLQKAYTLFLGLSGYRDADTRASELAGELGIAQEADATQ